MSLINRNFSVDADALTPEDIKPDDLVTYDYLRRIKTRLDSERYRLDSNDAVSVHRWAEKLRKVDSLLDYKQAGDNHPSLDKEDFVFIVQTPWQRRIYGEIGAHVMCIDGTHNTQVYGYTLFTLVSRDTHGHGMFSCSSG